MKKMRQGGGKVICVLGYLLVPVFFVILYCLMTQTTEDVWQADYTRGNGVLAGLSYVYHGVGRIGEYFTFLGESLMTPQATFGTDLLVRLLTAAMASGVIYLSAMMIVGRKLKLRYQDLIIYLGVFLLIMISPFSEVFTYKFNFVYNYILAMLITLGVLVVFRLGALKARWWQMVGGLVLGFSFGISSEIAPIAFIIIVVGWATIKLIRKELTLKELMAKYKVQILMCAGILMGIVFFYAGGGFGNKVNGGYGEKYNMIELGLIFSQPVAVIGGILSRMWFNLRYLFFCVPLLMIYVLTELLMFKKAGDKKYLNWQLIIFSFCALFVGGSSLIMVYDDLYARFMFPVMMAIVIATGLFVYHLFESAKLSEKWLKISVIVMGIVGVVMTIDMTYAFANFHQRVAPKVSRGVEYMLEFSSTVAEEEDAMKPSPLFNFKQMAPFGWDSGAAYLKFGL